MFIQVDEGFPSHRKTIRFCALMGSPEAMSYILRLWTWACRSCPTGDLTGMEPADIELAIQYRQLDGKCYAALVKSGFIDAVEIVHGQSTDSPRTVHGRNQDTDLLSRSHLASVGAPRCIHDWLTHTGSAISKMVSEADRKKKWRLHARGECAKSCELCKKVARGGATGQSTDSPRTVRSTAPDVQVYTEQNRTEQNRDPDTERAGAINSQPANQTGATRTALTGFDLMRWFAEERVAVFPGSLAWHTPTDRKGEASALASALAADEISDVRPSMALFWRNVRAGANGWSDPQLSRNIAFAFGYWRSRFTDLREELHGATPKVETKPDPDKRPGVVYPRLA